MIRQQVKSLLIRFEDIFKLLQTLPAKDSKTKIVVLKAEKILLLIKLDLLATNYFESEVSRKTQSSPNGFISGKKDRMEKEGVKKEIIKLVVDKAQVSSLEIYNSFPQVNKREIRRLITDLIKSGKLNRSVSKNLSFYSIAGTSKKPL